VFLPSWDRPSFTPIQNQKRSYSSVHFNLYILR
jgi:hypothetical protein